MAVCPACKKRFDDAVTVCDVDGERLIPDALMNHADEDVPAGTVVKEYRIEQKIGAGGFGGVYRAVHPLIGKRAAVKVLNQQYSTNPEMVARFVSEASVVNEIRHRNIIDIFDFGKLPDGRQFFLMELLEGRPLDKVLADKGRFTLEELLPILKGVVRALDAAHARGVAHRDLKPENIFVTYDEDGIPMPKLLDFGIAKLMSGTGNSSKTRTGTPMGTPLYMSPEQCRGVAVDHRTDIYSFGAMIHELLTGSPPFDGQTMMDVLFKQIQLPPPSMSSINANVPAALDAPVLHMLEKDPAKRPQSLGRALEDLLAAGNLLGTPMLSPRGSVPSPLAGSGAPPTTLPGGENLGTARTVSLSPGTSSSTITGTELSRHPGPRNFPVLAAMGGLVVLAAIGGVAVWKLRGGPKETAMPEVRVPTSAAAATGSLPPLPSAVEKKPAPEVEVSIRTNPDNAEVLLGGEKIGTTPGPIRLKRDGGPYALTIRVKGYKPKDVTIDESQQLSTAESITLTVALEKAKGAPTHKGISSDIPTGYP